MGLFLFIYMLIGMEIFAFKVPIKSLEVGKHHSNFNNILDAFLSVFIVLANNGWMTLFIDHYLATGSYVSSAFFISLLIIGQLILLNLFVAILIENFEQLSIRNDLISKLSNLKKGTLTEQIQDVIYKFKTKYLCFKNKVETHGSKTQNAALKRSKTRIDDLIDEDLIAK